MASAQRDVRMFEQEQQEPAASATAPAEIIPPAPKPVGTLPLGARLPQLQVSSPAMDQAVSGMLQGQQDLNRKLGDLQPRIEARRDALAAEIDKPLPAAPNLKPVPQFEPREISGQELTMFAGIAMALAGLGTKGMRGDLTMALNAAGNAMKGFNEGNIQQSRIDIENFRQKMGSVIAENQRMSEEYRNIIESRKLSLEQKTQALRVAAAARDDQIMLSALQSGQLKTVFDLESHRINATNQVALQAQRMYETAIHRQQQMADKAEQRAIQWAWLALKEEKAGQGRPLPLKAAQDITGRETVINMIDNLIARQEAAVRKGEGFGGYVFDQAGNLVMKAQRAIGSNPDEVQFFSDLETVAQPARHELFGATLTGGEQQSWRTGWVGAGDNPQTLLNILKSKRAQYQQMLQTTEGAYQRQGFAVGGAGPAKQQPAQVQSFKSEADARAAGVKPGTKVIINGVSGTWQD